MDGGAWWAAVHGVTTSPTRLSDFTLTFHFHALEKEMATTPVFLPGESQGQGSLVGCCPWGPTESDTTERLHFHFSPSCIGEGNGNPLQCSCLENPRDRGAWWAAVHGVAQSWTRLKRLSSSSSRHCLKIDRFEGQDGSKGKSSRSPGIEELSVVVRTEVNVTYHTPSFSWGKKIYKQKKRMVECRAETGSRVQVDTEGLMR